MFRTLLIAAGMLASGLVAAQTASVDERALKLNEVPSTRAPFVPADVATYGGDTTGGTDWVRPFADGTCCSGLGPVRFTTQTFRVSTTDTCDISSTQNGWDGYLFIYSAPFDPNAQTANFVAGDDDGNGGIGTSDIEGLALTGGTAYIAVTTGFANGDVGTFTNTISCPNATVTLGDEVQIVALPVPSLGINGMLLIAALVLLSGWVVARTRN